MNINIIIKAGKNPKIANNRLPRLEFGLNNRSIVLSSIAINDKTSQPNTNNICI